MDRIHELAEELSALIRDRFPDATNCDIRIYQDGSISLNAMEWGKAEGENFDGVPRRYFVNEKRGCDGWGTDYAKALNGVLSEEGLLLKEVC